VSVPQWFVVSLVLSAVLTVVVNVALRAFPGLATRLSRWLAELSSPGRDETSPRRSSVRVWVPWKAMIIVSIILTVLLNLLRWL
jgi:hypothetical protein